MPYTILTAEGCDSLHNELRDLSNISSFYADVIPDCISRILFVADTAPILSK